VEKVSLRKKLKTSRALFSQPHQLEFKSARSRLAKNLERLRCDLGAKEVWSYMAHGDEASADFSGNGCSVAVPKVVGEDLQFYFAEASETKAGAFGIREPDHRMHKPARKPDLILVPALGFDRQGGRLGSGKGFYDRLLKKYSRAVRVGVAYGVQVVAENLPLEAHDQCMDWIVTENFILQCQRQG
jgi:5,10-methenyltetrahydrofolate synthetase